MKIAILSSNFKGFTEEIELGYETRKIRTEINKMGGRLLLLDPEKLTYGIINNKAFAKFVTLSGEVVDVNNVDVLFIRRTRGMIEEIMDFAEFAERSNPKLVVCDPLVSFGRPTSKVESILRRVAKFPQPDTQVISTASGAINTTNFPVIAKPTHGASGKGVSKCNNLVELTDYLDNVDKSSSYSGYGTLVQQALDIDYEFRVMVVDGKGLGCVSKGFIPENPDVRNISQGSEFEEYFGPNKEDIINLAENLSTNLEQDISGVDIIQSDGKLFVIECNRNPQFQGFDFATRSNSAVKIVEMFKRKIDANASQQIVPVKTVDHVTNVFPRVFIGCSSEGLPVAEELQWGLKNCADAVIWNQGIFQPGENGLESLSNALHKYDYAIFCISPDDLTEIRNKKVFEPRDNVVFEAGLFMGKLGLDKVLLVVCSDEWPSLPSDLSGLTVVTWRKHGAGDIRPALAPAILDIKRRLRLR